VIYDRDVVMEILERDGLDKEDVLEFFEYNIEGAWMGEQTPGFLIKIDVDTF